MKDREVFYKMVPKKHIFLNLFKFFWTFNFKICTRLFEILLQKNEFFQIPKVKVETFIKTTLHRYFQSKVYKIIFFQKL